MRDIVSRPFCTENGVQLYYKEIAGNSDETKPTSGIVAGSWFHETDTTAVYAYDETDGWVQQFRFSEDGGGGGAKSVVLEKSEIPVEIPSEEQGKESNSEELEPEARK